MVAGAAALSLFRQRNVGSHDSDDKTSGGCTDTEECAGAVTVGGGQDYCRKSHNQ